MNEAIEASIGFVLVAGSLIYLIGALLIYSTLSNDPFVDNKTIKGNMILIALTLLWPIVAVVGLIAVIFTGPPRRPPDVHTK